MGNRTIYDILDTTDRVEPDERELMTDDIDDIMSDFDDMLPDITAREPDLLATTAVPVAQPAPVSSPAEVLSHEIAVEVPDPDATLFSEVDETACIPPTGNVVTDALTEQQKQTTRRRRRTRAEMEADRNVEVAASEVAHEEAVPAEAACVVVNAVGSSPELRPVVTKEVRELAQAATKNIYDVLESALTQYDGEQFSERDLHFYRLGRAFGIEYGLNTATDIVRAACVTKE